MDPLTFKDLLQGIGIVTLGVAVLLKIILPYVVKQKPSSGAPGSGYLSPAFSVDSITEAINQLKDLWIWHKNEVKPGVKNWWTLEEDRETWKRIERNQEQILDRQAEILRAISSGS